jgi:hypothetical protein
MKKVILNICIFSLSAILIISCKKKEEESVLTDNLVITEESSVQNEFDDVNNTVQDAMKRYDAAITGATSSRIEAGADIDTSVVLTSCATSTINTTAKTITIDFGTTDCLCKDGRTRRGVINIAYTGRYKVPGSVITTTLNNYYVNGIKVEGTKTVTHRENQSGTFDVSVKGGKLTFADGSFTTWTSSLTRTFSEGFSTPQLNDDVYTISGTTSGKSRAGVDFYTTLTNVVVKFACWRTSRLFPVSGSKTLTTTNGTVRIDFGNGECGRSVTVTNNKGRTFNVNLRN